MRAGPSGCWKRRGKKNESSARAADLMHHVLIEALEAVSRVGWRVFLILGVLYDRGEGAYFRY